MILRQNSERECSQDGGMLVNQNFPLLPFMCWKACRKILQECVFVDFCTSPVLMSRENLIAVFINIYCVMLFLLVIKRNKDAITNDKLVVKHVSQKTILGSGAVHL